MEWKFYALRAEARDQNGDREWLFDLKRAITMAPDANTSWELANRWYEADNLTEACLELQRCISLRTGTAKKAALELHERWIGRAVPPHVHGSDGRGGRSDHVGWLLAYGAQAARRPHALAHRPLQVASAAAKARQRRTIAKAAHLCAKWH